MDNTAIRYESADPGPTGIYEVSTDPRLGRPQTLEEIQERMYGRPTPAKRHESEVKIGLRDANHTFGNRRYGHLKSGAQVRLTEPRGLRYTRPGKSGRRAVKLLRRLQRES